MYSQQVLSVTLALDHGGWASVSKRQAGKGARTLSPFQVNELSEKATLALSHPTACFKSELHFEGEEKPQRSSYFSFIT